MSENRERPIGVDLEDTLVRYTTRERSFDHVELRPGAIVLLEGLRRLGRVPILDTMCDDGNTEKIFEQVPRLGKYFSKERRVTVTNRKKYDLSRIPSSDPRYNIYADLNERMAGGKNPVEYGADLLVDDMRSPAAEILGFKVIQIPAPEDDTTVGWAHRALEAIASRGKTK